MNDRFSPGMREATRLTRAGKLNAAVGLIQRLLAGRPAPDAADVAMRDETSAPQGFRRGENAQGPLARTGRQALWRNLAAPERDPGNLPADETPENAETTVLGGMTAPLISALMHNFLEQFEGMRFETGYSGASARPQPQPADLVPDGGQFIEQTFTNEAGSRTYKLYIPSGYRRRARPLILMLHGCKQSPDDFAAGTRMNLLAEDETCFVAYPAQSAAANFSKCWNWFRPGHQQRGEGEPSLIAGITQQIMRDYAIDPTRIYVAGLSAGAAAAAIMGMTYPDLYAAIGVHSGLARGAASDIFSAFAAMRRGKAATAGAPSAGEVRLVPAIVFHGDRDRTVHPCNGDQVIADSTIHADLRTRVEQGRVPGGHEFSCTIHSDAKGRTIFEQWVVHGAGHAWSGGSAAGSYTDPRGPDASREMLRFFLAHKCGA